MNQEIRCYPDCPAKETGNPADCDCIERDARARDAEIDAAIDRARDRWADAAYERRERDRDRAR